MHWISGGSIGIVDHAEEKFLSTGLRRLGVQILDDLGVDHLKVVVIPLDVRSSLQRLCGRCAMLLRRAGRAGEVL